MVNIHPNMVKVYVDMVIVSYYIINVSMGMLQVP
jgi:hypothetical protein